MPARGPAIAIALVSVMTAIVPAGATPPPSPFFTGLGFPPNASYTAANGISANGSVIVGISEGTFGPLATVWSGDNFVVLGTLGGVQGMSTAAGVSADGKVVVGSASAPGSDGNTVAFRWTAATGMIALGDFPDGIFASGALAASADGSVIVGYGLHDDSEAMRWTEATGMVGLGYLSGTAANGRIFSIARDVSSDGSVIVGDGSSSIGNQAFRWTQATGMVGLGGLPGAPTNGTLSSAANAISADGQVIVGIALNAGGNIEAFRWTQAGGMVGLGFLPNAPILDSAAIDLSADGRVIVGQANDADGNNSAVRWIGTSGPTRISDLLQAAGVNIGDRRLIFASGVSANGTTITGTGSLGAEGQLEAWWAVLPLPTNGCLQSQQNNNHTNACSPGRRAAFLSSSTLDSSLQSMSQSAMRALQSPAVELTEAFNANVDKGCDDSKSKLCLVEFSSGADAVGAVYTLQNGLRIGTRISYQPQTGYAGAFDGATDEEKISMTIFGSWQAEDGFTIYGAAAANGLEQSVSRGYLNGIDPVSSEGERKGLATAATVGAAWPFDLSNAYITPYTRYEYLQLTLDSYIENGGPFPAAFDAVDGALHVIRTGIEGRVDIDHNLSIDANAQWLYRLEGGAPDITARLLMFQSGFEVAGPELRDDWTELHLGLRYRTDEMSFRLSAGASDQWGEPATGANLEFGLRF